MLARTLAALIALTAVTTAVAQTNKQPVVREAPVWRSLERFSSDAEFLRYVRDVQRISGAYYESEVYYSVAPPPPAPPPPPPPPPPGATPAPTPAPAVQGLMPEQSYDSAVAVTAARVSSDSGESSGEPSSITNVQTQGVDEGGIVKQIGRYLIVLQDGRLFVVDTRAENGIELVNRTNVYRKPGQDTWYDELLTSGNRVLVTGYSYSENASEVTVLRLGDDGSLTREATYYISSNDYYDVENYSTRLVNGNLVVYTPLDVSSINPDTRPSWPLIRRWIRDDDRGAVTSAGRPLFDASDIYKPVQRTNAPVIHSVSVCPLGGDISGDELECRTTAFVGASNREFFVSTHDIYLWVTPSAYDLPTNCTPGADTSSPATIFQVPLDGSTPRAAHARGQPITQLALDASPTEFRALLSMNTGACSNYSSAAEISYFRLPFSAFSTTPEVAPARVYVETPGTGTREYEVRYTATHVVYGGREQWRSGPPGQNDGPRTGRVVAVPLDRPQNATTVAAPHNVIRIERAGGAAILTGYRTDAGLSVSVLNLGRRPRITETRLLQNRYESEGRSHAFNALVGPEGDGVMGLPTVTRVKEGGRWWWRSEASDVSFLTLDNNERLASAGELLVNPEADNDVDYQCEVSCVDWYGNTRALFIGSRIFALSATELIEGALVDGRVQERRRINLAAPVSQPGEGR